MSSHNSDAAVMVQDRPFDLHLQKFKWVEEVVKVVMSVWEIKPWLRCKASESMKLAGSTS